MLMTRADGAAARRTLMAKCARLDGLVNLAAALLSAGLPLMPARAQGTQMSVLAAASLTNATRVLRGIAQAKNDARSHSQASDSIVEQTDAAADPGVAVVGVLWDGTRPPNLAPAPLSAHASHREAAASPAHARSGKAQAAIAAHRLAVPSQGRCQDRGQDRGHHGRCLGPS
jgi:hypothetical protein